MATQRPFILDPLFTGIRRIPGIGQRTGQALEKLCGTKMFDLLGHLPISTVDRRTVSTIADAKAGQIVTLKATVTEHRAGASRKQPYRVMIEDDSGAMPLIFFKAWPKTLEKQFPIGAQIALSGKVDFYNGFPQMTHPDKVVPADKIADIARIEPIYPLTQGITHTLMNKCITYARDRIPEFPEWLNAAHLTQQKWPSFQSALNTLHTPESDSDFAPDSPARERLAYDELLATQLTLALIRQRSKTKKGQSLQDTKNLKQQAIDALPFQLTNGQIGALQDIEYDMAVPERMMRLLQGDVGSGKTAVAFVAMAIAAGADKQSALMAPTEILARQHLSTLQPLCERLGLRCDILTGREKGKKRDALLAKLAAGEIDLLIGTHALFQDGVEFCDLGLSIIDEQHRFGVNQRLGLTNKGHAVDALVMTATPIPRTLTLTLYGDMDVTRLTEKPAGRQPIDTRILSSQKLPELVSGLERKIKAGEQIYWVCPLVEDSEKIDLAAAEDRHQGLQRYFGDRVGLVHGRMKGHEKDAVMDQFKDKALDILVATTVIEVGVNVPNATVIVIEHAERFGLSQLHQLRGRVGRGDKAASCLLVYHGQLGDVARKRLSTMRDTEDGFVIAEADLKLRGGGEILGLRQSGLPAFKFANLSAHQSLLKAAHDDARLIIQKDPRLQSERGHALKHLLYLYEMDQAIRYLESG